jgi:hypothetical protein
MKIRSEQTEQLHAAYGMHFHFDLSTTGAEPTHTGLSSATGSATLHEAYAQRVQLTYSMRLHAHWLHKEVTAKCSVVHRFADTRHARAQSSLDA